MKNIRLKQTIEYEGVKYADGIDHWIPEDMAEQWRIRFPDAYADLTVSDVTLEHLNKFRTVIAKYRDLWRSLQVFVVAGKHNDRWIILASRITFSRLERTTQVEEIRPTSDALIVACDFDVDAGVELLTELVEQQRIDLSLRDKTFVSAELNWRNEWPELVYWQAANSIGCGFREPIWRMERNSGNWDGLFSFEFFQSLDRLLPLHDSRFANTEAVFRRYMPGAKISANSYQIVQFIATIPLSLKYHNDDGVLELSAPESAFSHDIIVSISFANDVGQRLHAPKDGNAWRAPVAWPTGILSASAKLYYDGDFIDEFNFWRWRDTVSIAARSHAHFDPKHTKLRMWLTADPTKDSQNNFERGVPELLNVLGIPTVHYGHGQHADALAVFQEVTGQTVALLIECTIQKPSVKFTPLLERARELRAHLNDEAKVIPIVFVRSQASVTDMEQAKDDGILLADCVTIQQLLEMLQFERTANEVMNLLRIYRIPFPRQNNTLGW